MKSYFILSFQTTGTLNQNCNLWEFLRIESTTIMVRTARIFAGTWAQWRRGLYDNSNWSSKRRSAAKLGDSSCICTVDTLMKWMAFPQSTAVRRNSRAQVTQRTPTCQHGDYIHCVFQWTYRTVIERFPSRLLGYVTYCYYPVRENYI